MPIKIEEEQFIGKITEITPEELKEKYQELYKKVIFKFLKW